VREEGAQRIGEEAGRRREEVRPARP